MDHIKIKLATLEVFERFNIQSFPIDCIAILISYGLKIKTYSSQKPKKREICLSYSEEAFTLKGIVYYNDEKLIGRVRFSLAHEIGHIALNHDEPRTKEQEKEADCFASYFLAPRMAIHYSGCKNHVETAKQFNVTYEAAQIAFDDYRHWYRKAVYKMDSFDKAMYAHFYNENHKEFVYSIKKCELCGNELHNSNSGYCPECFNKLSYVDYYKKDKYLHAAENNWLYGGL